MKPSPAPLIWGCIFLLFAMVFGSCRTASSEAAVLVDDGWEYNLTDELVVDGRLDYADKAAARYWDMFPACTEYGWRSMVVTEIGPHERAAAVGRGSLGGCQRWIDVRWLSGVRDYRTVCNIATHEIGHNLLFDHIDAWKTQDPSGVMSTDPKHPTVSPVECAPPPSDIVEGVAYTSITSKRSYKKRANRTWCRRNTNICQRRYPQLAIKSMPRPDRRSTLPKGTT